MELQCSLKGANTGLLFHRKFYQTHLCKHWCGVPGLITYEETSLNSNRTEVSLSMQMLFRLLNCVQHTGSLKWLHNCPRDTWNLPKIQSRSKPGWLQGKSSLLPSKSFHLSFLCSIKYQVHCQTPSCLDKFWYHFLQESPSQLKCKAWTEAVSIPYSATSNLPAQENKEHTELRALTEGNPAVSHTFTKPNLTLSPAQPLLNISIRIVNFEEIFAWV